MLTSEVLNRAADLIEQDGFGTGIHAMNVVGPHCVEGAIQAALGGGVRPANDWRPERYDYLADACPAGLAVRSHLADRTPLKELFMWNDQPGRTASEVLEVLRAAAAIEQAREAQPAVVTA